MQPFSSQGEAALGMQCIEMVFIFLHELLFWVSDGSLDRLVFSNSLSSMTLCLMLEIFKSLRI